MESGTPNDLTAVHFVDARHGYVSGAFSTLLKTSDGGQTWTSIKTPVSASFVSVAAKSADDVFIGRVGLYRSRDRGAHWDTDVGGYEAFSGSIFDILFITGNDGFFIKDGGIFATQDGGDHWDLIVGTGLFLDDIQHPGGETLFATGGISYSEIFGFTSRGDIARSRDTGKTWEVLERPEINEIHASAWYSQSVGLVFTFTNKAHRTDDGGDTWEVVTNAMQDTEGNPLPAIIMDAVIDSSNRIVAVDFDGNFLESSGGDVWKVTKGIQQPMVAMTKLPDGSIIAVGNNGNIWKRPSPDPLPVLPFAINDIRFDAEKGTVTLNATGTPGSAYQLATSLDLVSWKHTTIANAVSGEFSITVDAARDADAAYYRLEELPKPLAE